MILKSSFLFFIVFLIIFYLNLCSLLSIFTHNIYQKRVSLRSWTGRVLFYAGDGLFLLSENHLAFKCICLICFCYQKGGQNLLRMLVGYFSEMDLTLIRKKAWYLERVCRTKWEGVSHWRVYIATTGRGMNDKVICKPDFLFSFECLGKYQGSWREVGWHYLVCLISSVPRQPFLELCAIKVD